MLGSQRIGPDLANVGVRLPDPNWQLRHLYAPRTEAKESIMPPYPFLFEKRRIEGEPSPEALVLPRALAPEPGYEVVPTSEAKALAIYLMSLRADAPLFDAPLSGGAAAPATTTNAPAPSNTTSTNTATASAPGK
jgi:cytochrome c oxidase cbb3-type subunit 2